MYFSDGEQLNAGHMWKAQRSSSGAWRGFMRKVPCNEGFGVLGCLMVFSSDEAALFLNEQMNVTVLSGRGGRDP
jgi:hypothetical protein